MNNMLQNALGFLFVPESVLSLLFLIAFFAIFGYGVSQIRSCGQSLQEFKTNASERFAAERGRMNAANFIAHFDEVQRIREFRIEGLSNIFILVGILGTFLGLGIAIHGAADLLNAEKIDLAQLNAVLSVIAFKFQTSVWGTLFSLVFQKCLAEPYYMKRQTVLCETRKAISLEEVNTDAVLAGQLATLKSIREDQSDTKETITSKLASLEDSQKRFVTAGETIGKAFHASTIEQMANNAKHMEKFEALTEKIAKENAELNRTLTDAAKANAEHSLQTFQTRLSEELGDQRTQIREMMAQQNELNENLSNAQIDRLAENEETSRQYLQEMFEKQNELHRAFLGDATESYGQKTRSFAEKMDALFGDAATTLQEGGKSLIRQMSEALTTQQTTLENVLAEQNRLNTELAKQQMAMLGDTAETYKAGAKSFVEQVSEALSTQRLAMEDILDKQNQLNTELAKQQMAMLGDTAETYKAGAKSFVEQVNEALTNQHSAMQDVLTKQNQLTEEFFGSSKASFANETRNFIGNVTQALADQQKAVQDVLANQNRLNEEFFGSAKTDFGNETKSVVANITDALTEQRIHIQTLVEQQNKLNADLAAQQRALFGDAAESMEKSSQSFLSNITMQLAAQRGFMQELLQKQNEITAELNKAQKEFWGETKDAYANESRGFIQTMAEQVNLQKTFMQHIIEQQSELAKQINEQQRALFGESQAAQAKSARGFVDALAAQLEEQRSYMQEIVENQSNLAAEFNAQREAAFAKEKDERDTQTRGFLKALESDLSIQKQVMEGLVAEHSRLSKVLLGDLENTTKENLIAANKGFVQHMEEYKAFSEKISAEQKRVQDALESKLTVFAQNMSEATATNNANIAEISKAMGVLHKAIENNSLILKDIIENFYATQDNLDTVRRKEIKGLADAFSSMLEHESTSQASWRQGQETAKRAAAESAVKTKSKK